MAAMPRGFASAAGRRREGFGGRAVRCRPGAGQGPLDEQSVPEVVTNQTVKKPAGASKSASEDGAVQEVVAGDALCQRTQLPPRRQPLEDRLAEPELLAVGELGRG